MTAEGSLTGYPYEDDLSKTFLKEIVDMVVAEPGIGRVRLLSKVRGYTHHLEYLIEQGVLVQEFNPVWRIYPKLHRDTTNVVQDS